MIAITGCQPLVDSRAANAPQELVVTTNKALAVPVTNVTVTEKSFEAPSTEVLYTKVTPQTYGLLATRIINKMLDDTKEIYQTNPRPKIFRRDIIKEDINLPDGFYYANKNVKDILANSDTFVLTTSQIDADYHLSSTISEYINPNTKAPTIIYSLKLIDKEGNIKEEWVESLSQITNDDKSFW